MTEKQKLQKENLDLWKDVCLNLYGDRCLVCGQSPITFHHFIPKSRNGLMRYDLKNGVPLCQSHHWIIHKSPSPSEIHRTVEAIRKIKGKRWCNYIDEHEKIHESSFNTLKWLQDINNKLNKKL
jgi:predicted restriction endonuclease